MQRFWWLVIVGASLGIVFGLAKIHDNAEERERATRVQVVTPTPVVTAAAIPIDAPVSVDAEVDARPLTKKELAAQRRAEAEEERRERAEAAAQEKRDEEASAVAAVGRVVREGFVEEFASKAASNGLGFNLALGKPDTTLMLVAKSCNRQILDKLVELAGDHMRNVGFRVLTCGDSGPTVDIR